MNWSALAVGAALAVFISAIAWRLGALATGGMLAATGIGALTFGFGGLQLAVLLVAFFLSSSLLTQLGRSGKSALRWKAAKGGRRDAGQVLANGGLAGLSALVFAASGDPTWLAVGAASLAVVTADTWATELGVLVGGTPRLITTFRKAEVGASGAVSFLGTVAALSGALFMGLLSWWMFGQLCWGLAAALAGAAGSLVDSLLGATVQAQFTCLSCGASTEAFPIHRCGGETVPESGLGWLDNDWVNFLSALAGSGLAGIVLLTC